MNIVSSVGALARALLEFESDLYFHLSLYCLIPVVAGLCVEFIELVKIEPKINPLTGSLTVRPVAIWLERWDREAKFIGWVLVFLGVIGESFFEFAGLQVDSLASDVNTIVLTDVQGRADKAIEHGEELEEEAARLRTRAEREINARLALEQNVLWEGPRDVLVRSRSLLKSALGS